MITPQRLWLYICFVGLLFSSPSHANSLSPVEKNIREEIAHQQSKQLSLLEKLVNINSGTTHFSGVLRTGSILAPELEAMGFKTRWVNVPKKMQRAGMLIAERKGYHGKRLLLIGHLDTVFPKESEFQRFERQGNVATGPGVIDDKGGDVVMLYALKALHAQHLLDDTTITVVLTGDEENSGKPIAISRKPLFEAAHQSDIALDFEWAVTAHTATIARRGVMHWLIETQGNEAHSSQIFQASVGDGAIFEMARILNTMRAELKGEKDLSFNPGLILGGTTVTYDTETSQGTAFGKRNVVAKMAMAKGEVRFLTGEQKTNAEKRIGDIVKQHLPGTNASIHFHDSFPSMLPTSQNLALLEKYSEVSRDLGYGSIHPVEPGSRGAGDISHIASIVSANLAGLGPVGTGAHSEQESIELPSLTMQTQRAAILIYRLTHQIDQEPRA